MTSTLHDQLQLARGDAYLARLQHPQSLSRGHAVVADFGVAEAASASPAERKYR